MTVASEKEEMECSVVKVFSLARPETYRSVQELIE